MEPVLNMYITEGTRLVRKILISLSLFDSPKPHRTSIQPVYHKENKASGDVSHQFELVWLSRTLSNQYWTSISQGTRLEGKFLIISSWFDSPVPYCTSVEPVHHRNSYYNQFVPGTTPTPSYAPVHSPVKPFTLKLLNGHIKVCAGCRNGFRNPSSSLPGAPYDICICHEESREIIQPKTKQPATVWNKVHYHCLPACVQMNNPQFVPSLLLIPDDIQPKL